MKKSVGFRGSFWKKAEVQEKRRAQQQQQSLLDGNHVLSHDETRMRLGSFACFLHLQGGHIRKPYLYRELHYLLWP